MAATSASACSTSAFSRPLRHAKQLGMFALFATFLVLSLLGSVLSLRWARSVFKPIERMNAVIQRVEQGDSAARVGELASRDEIGRLAGGIDHLARYPWPPSRRSCAAGPTNRPQGDGAHRRAGRRPMPA